MRETSNEEVLHKQLVLPSILGKGSICKTSPGRDGHFEGRVKTFPTGKIGIWSTYPCDTCGMSNHNMVKCQEDNSCKKNHPRIRLKEKVISRDKRKGGMTIRDSGSKIGTRHSTLIVVRVDIR